MGSSQKIQNEVNPSPPSLGDPSQNMMVQKYWEQLIGERGAKTAYLNFNQTYQDVSTSEGHTAAHLFGGALFHEVGIDGISICETTFSFGCFHEFIGQALLQEGLSVLTKLNESCMLVQNNGFLGCQHGIGHGLLGYFGYDENHLFDALEVCHGLPGTDTISGCYGGVIMEFNMRTMLLGDNVPSREISENNYYEPCDRIQEYARQSCYYWQPQWWEQSLRLDPIEAYRTMGSFCATLTLENKNACYLGVGNNTPNTTSDPEVAVRLCEVATENVSAQFTIKCRSSAAVSFALSDALKDKATLICNGLENEEYIYCDTFRKNDAQNLPNIFKD